MLGKASQGVNSLTRGVKGGAFSSLGKPVNSMYEQNPGFFNRGGNAGGVEGFGQMLAQTREQRIAQAKNDGTFDIIRDKYNLDNKGEGMQMNEFGNLIKNAATKPKSALPDDTPGAASSAARASMMKPGAFSGMIKDATRPVDDVLTEKRGFGAVDSALTEKRGFGKPDRFFAGGESKGPPASKEFFVEGDPNAPEAVALSMQAPKVGDTRTITGKYGSGSSTFSAPGTERKEGTVNGQSFSEMMQGLANKQVREGTWREGDRLPEGMTADQAKKANEEARQKILSRQRIAAKTK